MYKIKLNIKRLTLSLFFIPFLLSGQQFSIITQSDSAFVSMQGVSNKALITSSGYFYFDDIVKAYIHSEEDVAYYREKFKELNIPLIEDFTVTGDASQSIVVKRANTELNDVDSQIDIEDLNRKILAFQKARSTGYALQLVGIGISMVGFALDEPAPIVGGGLLQLVGLISTASAGSLLK